MRVALALGVCLLSAILYPTVAAKEPTPETPPIEGESTDAAVIELTDETFSGHIEKHSVTLVEFYAPWCIHCKNMAPEYEKAAAQLRDEGHPCVLAKLDATENRSTYGQYEIKGFPTVKFFRDGKPEEYRGTRTADAIVAFVKQLTGPAVVEVTVEADVIEHKKEQPVVYIGHFTDKDTDEYKTFIKVAEGQRTKGKFIAYINSTNPHGEIHVERKDEEVTKSKIGKSEELEKFVLTEFFPLIGPISGENYADYSTREHEIVWFCGSPADYEKYGKTMREAAAKFRDLYSFVWLDSDQYGSHAEGALDIKEFPGLVLQSKNGRYVFPSKDMSSAATIIKFFQDVVTGAIEKSIKSEEIPASNSEAVKVVVAKNFEEMVLKSGKDVLLEVYAPWCGHCKKLDPIYTELAEMLQNNGVDHITIAKMDGTANESHGADFEWTGFPTIFFIKAGEEKPVRHEGARTLEALMEYLKTNGSKSFDLEVKVDDQTVKEEL